MFNADNAATHYTTADSGPLSMIFCPCDCYDKLLIWIVSSGYMIVGVAVFLILPVTSPLLDYIIPLENATRPKALPYYAEYGIDQEKYYYPLISQAIFGGIGTITVLVTYDLGFILVVQHVVALFALVK